jgi:hypothetical protein
MLGIFLFSCSIYSYDIYLLLLLSLAVMWYIHHVSIMLIRTIFTLPSRVIYFMKNKLRKKIVFKEGCMDNSCLLGMLMKLSYLVGSGENVCEITCIRKIYAVILYPHLLKFCTSWRIHTWSPQVLSSLLISTPNAYAACKPHKPYQHNFWLSIPEFFNEPCYVKLVHPPIAQLTCKQQLHGLRIAPAG